MRPSRWILLAPLLARCALAVEPVLDGGPISGSTDLGGEDLRSDDDPVDVLDAATPPDDVATERDDAVDVPPRRDVIDVPAPPDLGGCVGPCAPGMTRACGSCGRQTCTPACDWGPCAAEGSCAPGATRGCGNCGRQTCTDACTWGTCTGGGVCSPGQRRGDGCDGCSEQVCGTTCQWGGCQLRGGAACEYRSGRNSRACSRCRCGLQWCLATCQWSTDCVSCCTTCGGCS